MQKSHLMCVNLLKNQNKYWIGQADGNQLILHWGRVGTTGTQKIIRCYDEQQADYRLADRSNKKQEKGYWIKERVEGDELIETITPKNNPVFFTRKLGVIQREISTGNYDIETIADAMNFILCYDPEPLSGDILLNRPHLRSWVERKWKEYATISAVAPETKTARIVAKDSQPQPQKVYGLKNRLSELEF